MEGAPKTQTTRRDNGPPLRHGSPTAMRPLPAAIRTESVQCSARKLLDPDGNNRNRNHDSH